MDCSRRNEVVGGFRVVGNAAAWADIDRRRGRAPAEHICLTAFVVDRLGLSALMAFRASQNRVVKIEQ
jgi:hypothetical protein